MQFNTGPGGIYSQQGGMPNDKQHKPKGHGHNPKPNNGFNQAG
jgi:hypothetical protein